MTLFEPNHYSFAPNTATSPKGFIHSVDSCGTVDGPGVRFVVFTSGCPLRCLYCHNPDARYIKNGQQRSLEDVLAEIGNYHEFINRAGGGLTVSGGEPLLQAKFVGALLQAVKERYQMHTVLDTSGHASLKNASIVLPHADLVLLDIKSWHRKTYSKVTSQPIDKCLAFAELLKAQAKPTWVRYVLVPGLTDEKENLEGLSGFLSTMPNIERIEILPFHKMGEYKWESLKLEYQLSDVQPPSPGQIRRAKAIFALSGHEVVA